MQRSLLTTNRLIGLDIWRGIAIMLMIIYHFFFDLSNFGYLSLEMSQSWVWRIFRYSIISLFLFAVGVGLVLVHHHKIQPSKVWRRFWHLGLACIAVSVGSWTQFPDSWIYFGILHFILLASLLGLLFINRPILAVLSAFAIFYATSLGALPMQNIFQYLQPILNLPLRSEDFVPFFPWFGMVLLGIFFAHFPWYQVFFNHQYWYQSSRISQSIAFLGRHSLLIYLLHQPILFAGFIFFT